MASSFSEQACFFDKGNILISKDTKYTQLTRLKKQTRINKGFAARLKNPRLEKYHGWVESEKLLRPIYIYWTYWTFFAIKVQSNLPTQF
jgi:hypothetical protein